MKRNRNNSNGFRLAALSFLCAMLMLNAGCKKEEPVEKGCNTYGTLVTVSCGVSILNNLWIQLDNGKLLQPCETDLMFRCPPDYRAGQRVKFGYTSIDQNKGCSYMLRCALTIPDRKVIRISCLQIMPEPSQASCNLSGTVKDYRMLAVASPCGWIIEADNGVKVQPHNLPAGFVLRDGMRVTFSYNELQTLQAICFGAVGGEITCIREQMCIIRPTN